MSSYLDYMDDPDIVNEPRFLREVHAIRLMIQDETKNMSPEQRMEYTQKTVIDAEEKYGIKFRRPSDVPVCKAI